MMDEVDPALEALASRVIGSAIEVHRELGPGFLEATYQKAMEIELGLQGIPFLAEAPTHLTYKDHPLADGRIDLLVEGRLVVELKAVTANPKKFNRQASNYLKSMKLPLGLVINFENELLKDGIARVILSEYA